MGPEPDGRGYQALSLTDMSVFVEDKDYIFTFGKHEGLSVEEVLEEPGGAAYLCWCMDNLEWFDMDSYLYEEISEDI